MAKNQAVTIKREIRANRVPQKFSVRTNGDGTKSVSGYFAKFNSLSSDLGGFFERISPGAFKDSLKSNPDVLAYYNHNGDLILGRVSSGTLSVSEDSTGLRFDVKLPKTSYADDLVSLMQRGDVTGCSFGFSVPNGGDDWQQVGDQIIRTVNKAILYEGSIVGQPAYPETVADLRSAPSAIRAKLIKSKPTVRRTTITKKVDGENLTADDFLIVGDPSKTDTWHLPWKFSTEEKTISHLRDALSRFDQVEGVSDSVLHDAWAKLLSLCKQHGIDVSKEDSGSGARSLRSKRTWEDDNPCNPDSDAYDADACEDQLEDEGEGDEDERCECDCRSCDLGFCDLCIEDNCDDLECSQRACPMQSNVEEDDPDARSMQPYYNRLLALIVSGR
jgi:uncharacterized protein